MDRTERFYIIAMFFAMSLWAVSWPCSKILIQQAHPYLIAFMRFVSVWVCILPLMFVFKIPLLPRKKELVLIFVAGVCNALYSLLFFQGLTFGDAGRAGVITMTLSPIFGSLLSMVFGGVYVSVREKLGLVLGFVSGIFLLHIEDFSSLLNPFNLFFVGAALAWTFVTLVSKKALLHPLKFNCYVSCISALLFAPYLVFGEGIKESLEAADSVFWICFLVVSILSVVVATSIFYKGVEVLGVHRGGSFLLLVPVFALVFSFFILGEEPDVRTIIGCILAILAIYMLSIYKASHLHWLRKYFH
ncbi:DMT family transporter [uncultured Helicobacter sp.]|uniref:DMT family transporter n=1 Tax=uncultured Helicobacter sp. TaxID=175537 RepID=UPI001C3AAAC3|nr:DMT family transporter [Candidatus Helicobacter avicola]